MNFLIWDQNFEVKEYELCDSLNYAGTNCANSTVDVQQVINVACLGYSQLLSRDTNQMVPQFYTITNYNQFCVVESRIEIKRMPMVIQLNFEGCTNISTITCIYYVRQLFHPFFKFGI
eukprot:TRINITY_DN10785_c0_g1_i2.p3 TRINITY_DN10785_c0_g1~~TRINITY_DN10785_c0_g1_i2.p3  ORF type:complete len:118 (-),score=3.64 TRINITY_DN10785_c0_g1_i2:610-963(-)